MLCNSCNVQLDEEASRNAHYRSDWHRYNLKRKVAGLPGVTEEWFEEKKTAAAAAASALTPGNAADKGFVQKFECTVCQKEYGSEKNFENHLKSKGHADRAAKAPAGTATSAPVVKTRKVVVVVPETPDKAGAKKSGMARLEEGEEDEDESEDEEGEWEEVDDDEEAAELMEDMEADAEEGADEAEEAAKEASPMDEGEVDWDCSRCLFCDQSFGGSIEDCVAHMHKTHGFFVPDAEFVTDLSGMLTYLALKINSGRLCLYCDERGKAFPTSKAARAHMEAKCHAKLRYGDGSGIAEEELEEFYDFSSSYEEAGTSMAMVASDDSEAASHLSLQRGGVELVIRRPVGSGDDADSGKTKVVGSREYARYYRQRPRPTDEASKALQAVVSRYKSMGLSTRGLRSFVDKKELARRDTGVKASRRAEQFRTKVGISNNVIRNLPKNVPY